MKKRTLERDIKKCFAKSKGRFISIVCLIALGSFALVGLQVAGPDMRYTGENYFNKYKLADISIIVITVLTKTTKRKSIKPPVRQALNMDI